jgi:hypothetical protein
MKLFVSALFAFCGVQATGQLRRHNVNRRETQAEGPNRHLQSASSCLDVPGWFLDEPMFDCEWFGQKSSELCASFLGSLHDNGHTANTACCACGGGTTYITRHIQNTYCNYYEQGGDGGCSNGSSFADVWKKCDTDGVDKCMGVMWSSCEGATSDTTVNGAWKLMDAGQTVGDADHSTDTCGGKDQARGHWDVFVRMRHVPNTYCKYYASGGDGGCSDGKSFNDVWRQCDEDGADKCMGVMWNSCEGETSDTTVNGAWKLITAGQDIGDADHPTDTCGGKDQARGHWDVFIRV